MKKIRVRRWRCCVCQDHESRPNCYTVYAVSSFDAKLLAYALDHGFPVAMTEMTQEHVEEAIRVTRIV